MSSFECIAFYHSICRNQEEGKLLLRLLMRQLRVLLMTHRTRRRTSNLGGPSWATSPGVWWTKEGHYPESLVDHHGIEFADKFTKENKALPNNICCILWKMMANRLGFFRCRQTMASYSFNVAENCAVFPPQFILLPCFFFICALLFAVVFWN